VRVGLLAYGLDRPLTGISRYTIELAKGLARLKDGPELVLLRAGSLGALEGAGIASGALPGCRLLPGLMTLGNVEIPLAAARWGLDIVHDPVGVAPFFFGAGRAKTVVTLHDVLALSSPGHSAPLENLIHRFWLPRMIRRVRAVITASSQSREDILKFLHPDPTRLTVLPYGVAGCFHPLPADSVKLRLRERFDITGPYILFAGALTARKNLDRLAEAWRILAEDFPRHELILAGPFRGWTIPPHRDRSAGRIRATGPVSDDDLAALYNGCEVFVFPSLYEGFGLPPLEAMACGAPVLCSNASSLPEVVGDAARLVDPYDARALAAGMRELLADAGRRQALSRRGLRHSRAFTWARNAAQTMEVYRKIVYH